MAATISPVTKLSAVVLILAAIFAPICGHVALTYPPARQYSLDFLDNQRTQAPCGMPKGKAFRVFRRVGTIKVVSIRDKTMTYKKMYIPNDDTKNYHFCRLQSVVEMFAHLTL